MNQHLIKQAEALFDNPEKWDAFLELTLSKADIKNFWFEKLKQNADNLFHKDEIVDNWIYRSWNGGMQWYQKDYGQNSISLWFEDYGKFSLYCDPRSLNITHILDSLRKKPHAKLLNCFNKLDDSFNENGYLATEYWNFSFDDNIGAKFDSDRIAWYAGNKTDEFVAQIVEKVNRFRKDDEMNSLLYELNTKHTA